MKFRLVTSALLAGASSLAMASVAGAQEQLDGDIRTGSDDPDSRVVDAIVVTGSRIPRSTFTSPAPLTVVDQEAIRTSGFVNIDDVLQRVPSIGVGLGSQNTLRQDDAGAAFVNLRGLGLNRSLTVINGRRRVSGSRTSSAVDLNTIPANMIERVEVITGGASAIYGADAVSGVVNVITRSDFDGLELAAQGGISDQGDGENFSLSLHGGTNFSDDRGSLNFGVSYSDQAEVQYEDRAFGQTVRYFRPNPANTGPNDGVPDQIAYQDHKFLNITDDPSLFFGGDILVWTGQQFEPFGGEVINGAAFGSRNGGLGSNWIDRFQLRIPVSTLATRADIDYELTQSVAFSAEFEYAQTDSTDHTSAYRFDERAFFFGGAGGPVIQRDNAFLPQGVQDFMDANAITEFNIRKKLGRELGFIDNNHDRSTFNVIAGFNGALPTGWNWEASYQYGEYNDEVQSTNLLIHSNFLNAVDVIADPVTGEPVCRDEAARADGCVPINLFSNEPYTDEQRAYAVHTRLQDVETTQTLVALRLNGDLVELPAGPLAFAAGGEYREETLFTLDDGLSLAGEIQFLGLQTARPSVDESFEVYEGYVEIRVPLLGDTAFAKRLEVEGAVRVSDYNTIGTTVAWKGGLNWEVNDDFRLRGTVSRSVRAPNLVELFAPANITNRNFIDPCDATVIDTSPNRAANCAAFGFPPGFTDSNDVTEVSFSGNPDLQEETSDSYTIGVVFTPSFIEGLSLSLDYYNISIEDAVSTFGPEEIAARCFDAASADNLFCDQIVVGPTFNIDFVNTSPINVSELNTSGLDFAVTYQLAAGPGVLALGLFGTYLIELETLGVPGDAATLIVEHGEFTAPRLRFTSTIDYRWESWRGTLINRFIGESEIDAQATPEQYDNNIVDARVYTDLNVQYDINENLSAFVGVNNLFDILPPNTPATYFGGQNFSVGDAGAGALYDNIGRFFKIGVRAKL